MVGKWRSECIQSCGACVLREAGAGWLWVVWHRRCLNTVDVPQVQTEVRTVVRRCNITISTD